MHADVVQNLTTWCSSPSSMLKVLRLEHSFLKKSQDPRRREGNTVGVMRDLVSPEAN